MYYGGPCGESRPDAKLSNKQAEEIRNSPLSHRKLAALYGVNSKSIQRIKKGESYAKTWAENPMTSADARLKRRISLIESKSIPEPNSGCWLWMGRAPSGYGTFREGNRTQLAHRASYEVFVGPIPSGLFVCHRCDVPLCVNPQHLFLGTQKENLLDCAAKGRTSRGDKHSRTFRPSKGEANGFSKLTESAVIQIRHDLLEGMTVTAIARKNGVSRGAIYWIKNGVLWTHAEEHGHD